MTSQPEAARAVLCERIDVDDRWHPVRVAHGAVLHVAARSEDTVDMWHLADTQRGLGPVRMFRIFGTGHRLPSDAEYVGTAVTPSGDLVRHLFEDTSREGQ